MPITRLRSNVSYCQLYGIADDDKERVRDVSGAPLGDLLKELEVHRTYLTAVGRFCRDAGARSDNRSVRIEIGNLWHNLNFHAAVIERVEQIDAARMSLQHRVELMSA
jgi:hypothetical protein